MKSAGSQVAMMTCWSLQRCSCPQTRAAAENPHLALQRSNHRKLANTIEAMCPCS